MNRYDMIERIGNTYMTSNIEGGEYSYVLEAGSKAKLEELAGHSVNHFKLDIRFEDGEYVVLVETKQNFVDADEKQLAEYLEEERALHTGKKLFAYSQIPITIKSRFGNRLLMMNTLLKKKPFLILWNITSLYLTLTNQMTVKKFSETLMR